MLAAIAALAALTASAQTSPAASQASGHAATPTRPARPAKGSEEVAEGTRPATAPVNHGQVVKAEESATTLTGAAKGAAIRNVAKTDQTRPSTARSARAPRMAPGGTHQNAAGRTHLAGHGHGH
ncbi:hypothetical protein GCM10023172_29400 [Hymenobacter ginsengisoli]|uniref:Uncharacterized protein n=2 Tax=Hymenobacteraceae TaxID=1853232 RepID=A0ABP8QK18_9BACT